MSEEIEEVKQEEPYKSPVNLATLGKRTIFGVIDLVLFFIFFFMLLGFVVEPLFNVGLHTRSDTQTMRNYQLASGLYVPSGESGLQLVDEENYQEVATTYYESYCRADAPDTNICKVRGQSLYDVIQNEEGLKQYFVANDEKEIIINYEKCDCGDDEDGSKAAAYATEVWELVYGKAIQDFRNNETFKSLNTRLTQYLIYETIISMVVSSMVFYLIIPLCLPNGKTLGKLMMKSSLANVEGFKVRKSQIIVRYISFTAFNIFAIVMSVFTPIAMLMVLLPFVSFTIMVFSKKQASLHDLCSATIVVDDNTSVIYKNKEDYLASLEKQKMKEIKNQRKRKETIITSGEVIDLTKKDEKKETE